MKNLIIKLFVLICALVFLAEGAVLLLFWLKYFNLNSIIVFYNTVFASPKYLQILLGFCGGFLFIALIFLIRFVTGNNTVDSIILTDPEGETVRIPIRTITDFTDQIINLNSHLSDVEVNINRRGKWILFNIACAYSSTTPVRQEVQKLKEVLKGEIERVFEFEFIRINFQLKGVNAYKEESGSKDALKKETKIEEKKHKDIKEEIIEEQDEQEIKPIKRGLFGFGRPKPPQNAKADKHINLRKNSTNYTVHSEEIIIPKQEDQQGSQTVFDSNANNENSRKTMPWE